MNILITGAGGQLGRTLKDVSAGYDYRCIFTDVQESDGVDALDVTDSVALARFLSVNPVDVIVNCAAYTNVDAAEDNIDAARTVNVTAPAVLAAAAKETGAVLIHISTDYVFDGNAARPYTEEDQPSPVSVYGKTKYEGEQAVISSGCRYLIFRTAWLYSGYGRNFFLTMVEKTSAMPSLKVVADQVGSPTYAADLADLIFHVIDNRMLDRTGVYHFTDEGVCSWYDFAKAICEGVGNLCEITPCHTGDYPSKAPRPHYSVLDKTKVKSVFGFEIPHWRDSLFSCIQDTFK